MANRPQEAFDAFKEGTRSGGCGDGESVVRSVPVDRFGQVAVIALSEVTPQEYQSHQLARPITRLGAGEQADVIQTVISELQNQGLNREEILKWAPVLHLDPYRMHNQEVSALLIWTRQHYPEVLARAAGQYHQRPDIVSCLLGQRALERIVASLSSPISQASP